MPQLPGVLKKKACHAQIIKTKSFFKLSERYKPLQIYYFTKSFFEFKLLYA